MPRPSRIVVPGVPHHITHRGNQGRDLFFAPLDRVDYLLILKKQCERTGLIIHGFCLMNNHIHLIATPPTIDSLSSTIGQAHHQFTEKMNAHRKLKGPMWEGRFYSCPMDEVHFARALVYVDRNPVRAGLVSEPTEWTWSSAKAHFGEIDRWGLIDPVEWGKLSAILGFVELMNMAEDQSEMEIIERCTMTGRPLGDDRFMNRLEGVLGFPVLRNSPGRPLKKMK